MSVSEPGKIITPWAESGLKNTIPPAANPATGRAGFDQGFSAINMTAKEAGGIPPFGQDFNGIFYEVTNILRYMQAGGQPTYDAAFAAAIGGYPKGAMVLGSDGVTLWQSMVDSNSTDPNTDPSDWGAFDIGLKADLAAPSGSDIVGFQQAGAGSVLRTVQDKVSEGASIRDFATSDALLADGSAALQSLFNYCSTNGVRGIVDVPVNCNNKTLTVDSNTDISFVGAGKLLNGSLTITGSLGSEVACTSDTARGQAVINVPGATFSVGNLIYIKSCINSMSPDAGDDRLGATLGDVCYFAEFARIVSKTASTITVDRPLTFQYPITPGPDSGLRTTSTVAVVTPKTNIRIRNIVMRDKSTESIFMIRCTFGEDVDISGKFTLTTSTGTQQVVAFDRSLNCVVSKATVNRPISSSSGSSQNSLMTLSSQHCGFRNITINGGGQCVDISHWLTADIGAPSVDCFVESVNVYNAKSGPTSHPGNYGTSFYDINCYQCVEGVRLRSKGDILVGFNITKYAAGPFTPTSGSFGVYIAEGYNEQTIVSDGKVSGYAAGVSIGLSENGLAPSTVSGRILVSNVVSLGCLDAFTLYAQAPNNINRQVVLSDLVSIGNTNRGIFVGAYNNGVVINNFTAIGPFGPTARSGIEWGLNVANLTINGATFSGMGAVYGLRGPSASSFLTDLTTFPLGNAEANLSISGVTYVGHTVGFEDSGIIRDLSAFNSSLNGYTNGYVVGSNRVRQQSSQTADVQEWQNSSGSKVLGVSTVGKLSGSQAAVVKNAITAATDVTTLKTALLNLFA